jgi:hypothetical protein
MQSLYQGKGKKGKVNDITSIPFALPQYTLVNAENPLPQSRLIHLQIREGHYLSFIAGSPSRIQVLRTSELEDDDFARITASPSVNAESLLNSKRYNSLFSNA